jgi:hypothetical protein
MLTITDGSHGAGAERLKYASDFEECSCVELLVPPRGVMSSAR